jgi:hypothetical protein
VFAILVFIGALLIYMPGKEMIGGREMTGYTLIGNRTGRKFFVNASDLSVYLWDGSWNRR